GIAERVCGNACRGSAMAGSTGRTGSVRQHIVAKEAAQMQLTDFSKAGRKRYDPRVTYCKGWATRSGSGNRWWPFWRRKSTRSGVDAKVTGRPRLARD